MMVRGAGRLKFKENDEPKYLGPSSGLAITRLVMEMAKQNTDSKSIKDVVPEVTAQEIKDTFTKESSKPTSKIYPMISSMPQEELPPRNLTYRLIDLFVVRGTSQVPYLCRIEQVFANDNQPNTCSPLSTNHRSGKT